MVEGGRRGALTAFSVALGIGGAALALLGGSAPVILVGVGLAVLAGVVFFRGRLGAGQVFRGVPTSAQVSTPSQMRVKPIVKLREEVVAMIEANRDNPVVATTAFDTVHEVDAIVLRSVELLEAKRRLTKLSANVFPSRAAVASLEKKLAGATDEAVRASTTQALETRREELRILEDMEAQIARLEANLDEAEAALAEVRTQLLKVVSVSHEQRAVEEIDPLAGMTERLRGLSSTMEQSVGMVSKIGNNE